MAVKGPPRGRLVVFLGAAPGVGKTTAMLAEAARLADAGADVVLTLVESRGRAGTEARAEGLERVPLRRIGSRDTWFEELDVDGVLNRHPRVALVDELAHTNVAGSHQEKRRQDVEELLASGIDAVTNLNVSHLDSLDDTVEALTGVVQHETVPDGVITAADQVHLVEASPEALQARLSEGALLVRVMQMPPCGATTEPTGYPRCAPSPSPGSPPMASVPTRPSGLPTPCGWSRPSLVRPRAATSCAAAPRSQPTPAASRRCSHREPSGLVESHPDWLDEQRRLLAEPGGR
jgi:hypothetical protein